MLAGMLAFATGVFSLLHFTSAPSSAIYLLLPLIFILSYFYRCFRLPMLFLCGFCWAMFRVNLSLEDKIGDEFTYDNTNIVGVIASLPKVYPDHVRFKFKLDTIQTEQGSAIQSNSTVRLSWYRTPNIPIPGERWQFKVKLKHAHGFMNPGGFDYETWLLRQGINGLAYVRQDGNNQRLAKTSSYLIQDWRYRISEKIKRTVQSPLLGFTLALTLGDRTLLTSDQRKLLINTGTSHLIAISGLHLALIAGFVYLLGRVLFSQSYFITQRVPAPVSASLCAFFIAFLYAAMAGFTLPTQRALIMIGLCFIALLSGRRFSITNIISVAIVLILLLDPFAIISVDFCLSFAAVCFIVYLSRYRVTSELKFFQFIKLQGLLSLALMPLLIFWFKQIPVYSAIANMLAIPILGFVILPILFVSLLFLFISPVISSWFLSIVTYANDYFWKWLALIEQSQDSVIPIAMPDTFSLCLATIGVLILLMPKGLPGRWVGLLWLTPLLFPQIDKPEQNEFDFTLLDVGQGLSAVIQTKEHVLVYDTGARYSDRFNIGDAVIMPYLRYQGIDTVSTLLISHGDTDHIGGAKALIESIQIDKILSSVPEKIKHVRVYSCHDEQHWQWDGVSFEILHPDVSEPMTGNNASCVLKVSGQYGSVLLSGDIEWQAEQQLLKRVPEKLKADVLIVPHHGSKTSSTLEFIRQVDPKYALFPAGYRNRFGFPKQDIMTRYTNAGIDTLVSYQTGAISTRFGEKGLKFEAFREQNRRFWHHKGSIQ